MKKRVIALMLCMTVVLGAFSGCAATAKEETYSVTVASEAGKALAEANVEIYEGSEVVATGTTNEEGKVEFTLPVSDTYKIVVSNLSRVYTVEAEYAFTDKVAEIVPGSFLPSGRIGLTEIKTGDTMFEFTLTASDGKIYSLTDLLAEKELVVINFWYESCGYCSMELPFLIENYEMYQEDMEILAMNPFDDLSTVKEYIQYKGVPYPMGLCSEKWSATFGLRGYPTSVLIDRNGVVKRIIVGALSSTEEFSAAFQPFFGDDYE